MLAGCLVGQRRCGVGWLLSESAAMRCWLVAQSVGGGAVLAGFSVSQRRAGRFVKTSSIHPWRLRRVIPDAKALLHGLPVTSFRFVPICLPLFNFSDADFPFENAVSLAYHFILHLSD